MDGAVAGINFPPMFIFGAKIVAVLVVLVVLHAILRAVFAKKGDVKNESKIFLFPKCLRVWHWVNAATFLVLTISGLSGWLKLLPKQVFLGTHLVFATLFIFSWVFIVAYNAAGGYSSYKITKSTFGEALGQIKYYLFGVFKGEKNTHTPTKDNKFNALQKLSYFFVVYFLMPMFIITGMLEQSQPMHKLMVQTHIFFCTFAFVLFLVIHIYMVLSGSYLTQKIKSMIDGYSRHS